MSGCDWRALPPAVKMSAENYAHLEKAANAMGADAVLKKKGK